MKKWIFITTCTVVVLLSTVNVYRVLGDWNTPFLSMLKLEQLAYGEGGIREVKEEGIHHKGFIVRDIWMIISHVKYQKKFLVVFLFLVVILNGVK